MASLNKAMIIGNLGRDPEIRYTQDGKAITSFSIATTDRWRDKSTGENREKTEWHRVVAFDRLGEICGEYLSKGKPVYIEGRLQTRSWEKDGVTRYTTEIIATGMQMLGSKSATGDFQSGSTQGGGAKSGNDYGGDPSSFDTSPSGPDDDIPF